MVTGTGSLIGQAIIKSIKKSDLVDSIKIIGADYFSDTVGSFWCSKNYILPDILNQENKKQWQTDILKIIEDENISILFVGVDFELILFSEMKDHIMQKTGCKVVVSDKKTLLIGNDKYLTYEFLKENMLNYPKTWLPTEVESAAIEYPCIIKPRVGARSKGVFVIKNKEELMKKLSLVEDVVIQELIGDNDSEYSCGILFEEGKLVNSIALKRSLKEGNTYIAEYKKNFSPDIYRYIEDVALLLQPFGGCNLQLRLGRDSKPYLFEINPRYSGTTYMRSLFGFKEVEYTIKSILGYDTKPFKLKEGKIYRYYEEKFLG